MQRYLFLKTSAFPVTEGESPTDIARTRAGIRGYKTIKIYKKISYKNYCEAGKQVLCKHINAF